MGVDKFFCKTADEKVTDKHVEFPSEKEANEYCKENGIDPHNVILMGDKYIIKTKDSNFRTTIDKAIRLCDANPEKVAELFRSYYNGKVTAEKLKNVSKSDLGALEWSIKQIPRLIKQGKPSHLINAENMQIERILKSYGII